MDLVFGRRSVVVRIGPGESPGGADALAAQGTGAPGAGFVTALEKYELIGAIGQGGMGEVVLVHDRDLRREVAMKLIRPEYAASPDMQRMFVAEAQATSQLEHPGIPPVHDIGLTPDGKVYFTLKVVRGRTLAHLLKDLFLGATETRQVWNLHKLVSVLERVAEAVHFAHERAVIHRDLKPENVMLGEFGEVHVMDWGLAKVAPATGAEGDEHPSDAVRTVDTDAAMLTQVGTVKGTIPYMSPEQARGEALDRRTDVYALGAILYEMLTLYPAFAGPVAQLVARVRSGDFPDVATRNSRRPVPEPLADLCRRAMAKDPSVRPATARDFGDVLRRFLDGRADRERRHREAEALVVQGREAVAKYAVARAAIDVAENDADEIATRFHPWHGVEETAPLLDARARVGALRDEAAASFAAAANLFGAALLAEPDHAAARAALADMWRDRVAEAEERRVRDEAALALRMVRRYDDGRLAAYVAGDGTLELASDPPGAEVVLYRFEDRRGLLVPGEPRALGRTPLATMPLPMGSYLCILSMPGFRDVRYPVHIGRNRAWVGRVRMRTDSEIGEDFVYVPGGPFVHGEGRRTRTMELPDFAIARLPVTYADWGEALAAIEREEGLDAARRFVPSVRGDGDYMARTDDGRWIALPVNCEGPARERCFAECGPDFYMRLPVSGVSWHDAVAYCAWRTRATGREWRLPTEEEREKAARGVDGRRFPWGELDNATLGKCRDTRPEPTQPEPVGRFPTATSVYGMVDASGNSWDWTDSWFDARRLGRVAKGGAWLNPVNQLRCAARNQDNPAYHATDLGLRAARSL